MKQSTITPPIVNDYNLLSEIDTKSEDATVRPIVNRLWR